MAKPPEEEEDVMVEMVVERSPGRGLLTRQRNKRQKRGGVTSSQGAIVLVSLVEDEDLDFPSSSSSSSSSTSSSSSSSSSSSFSCTSSSSYAAEEVRVWLRSLEYEHYAAGLLRAGFDSLRALPHLDDHALLQCGVTLVGHRRVLTAAATALREQREAEDREETRRLLARHGHGHSAIFAVPSALPRASTPSPRRKSSITPPPEASTSSSKPSCGPVPSHSPSAQDGHIRSPRTPSPTAGCRSTRGAVTPSPERPSSSTTGSVEEGMRGLFGELLDRPRMYMMKKPITAAQFNTINDLLGGIVDHEEQMQQREQHQAEGEGAES